MVVIRDSLKQCIHQAYWNFRNEGATEIAITRCERGKYYSVMLGHELLNKLALAETRPEDIVFSGSRRELHEFVNPKTPELKLLEDTQ